MADLMVELKKAKEEKKKVEEDKEKAESRIKDLYCCALLKEYLGVFTRGISCLKHGHRKLTTSWT